jgi:branched-chain amino acid transport system permease protein
MSSGAHVAAAHAAMTPVGARQAALLAAVFIVVGLAVPQLVGSVLLMTLLAQATISALLAMSVGTLLRLNGTVSFGQAAFYGMAVYIVGLSVNRGWMPAEAAIVLALLVPALLGLLLGLGIVNIPGIAFSMLTLAVGQACFEFAMKAREVTGGEDGMAITFPGTLFGVATSLFQRPQSMFMVCWVVLVLLVFALAVLTRSPFGRLVEAIRENEERARFIGYRTRLARALVLALSGFIAALGGVLSALYNGFASPDVLHWSLSGSALIMVVIGGPRLLWGPAFGAIVFFFLKDIAGNLSEHWPAMIGLTLIAVTLLVPLGLGGVLAARIEAWRRRGKPEASGG